MRITTLRKYAKYLPWALPLAVLLFDLANLIWMLSHEPGITQKVAWRFQLLLLPGVLFGTDWAIVVNCALAAVAGTVVFWLTKAKA
jgi:hypothetical protein